MPDTAFYHFLPANDWFIAYPSQQLIHLHFGRSTASESENIAETNHLVEYVQSVLAQHTKPFSLVFDFTQLDDSEFIPPTSVKRFVRLFADQRIAHAVVYGGTAGLQDLIRQFVSITHTDKVSLVGTYEEAVDVSRTWKVV